MNPGVLLAELWQSWRASLRRPGFVLLAGLIGNAIDGSMQI